VRVVLLCRVCDIIVPAEKLLAHLSTQIHAMGAESSN
jgi:hypothetical protein